MKENLLIAALVLGLLLPLSAGAQASAPYQFQRQGIFDCNQNGAYAMSVGALAAIGGTYVPVADSAVELNTGTLVYKECVLREVVDRERESAMAAFLKKANAAIQAGRNTSDGRTVALYVVNERQELLDVSDRAFLPFLQNGALQNLNPTLQRSTTVALARNYEAQTRGAERALICPYKSDLDAALAGRPGKSVWDALLAVGTPACNPMGAYYLSQNLANARIAQALQYQQDQWNWGQGFYARTDNAQDPLQQRTLTPSVNVQESFQTILDSPVRQLESANDIGQMIGALYAGVTTEIISDSQGLAGLTQGAGGQPSYLDQVATESSQGLRNAAANVALQILNASRQVESAYFQVVSTIGATLTQAIANLRGAESQCWNLIIPKVCATPLAADNTCTETTGPCTTDPSTGQQTCPTGGILKIATSTTASQAVIDSSIAPLASQTIKNIESSQKAIGLIDSMIAGVTNTSSLDAQRVSLQQLDSLVAQHMLHTQPDLQTVTQQLQNVQGAMTTLVTNTVQSWADSTDPNVGWCNYKNPAVIRMWAARWKK